MNLDMQIEKINSVKKETVDLICKAMGPDVSKIILYGSCARGDYTADSDIDIALLVKCDRIEAKRYTAVLAEIATKLAMKYFVVTNFVCLPDKEYEEKKSWYPYFKSIAMEGEVLYG